jgi:hypothetical protein
MARQRLPGWRDTQRPPSPATHASFWVASVIVGNSMVYKDFSFVHVPRPLDLADSRFRGDAQGRTPARLIIAPPCGAVDVGAPHSGEPRSNDCVPQLEHSRCGLWPSRRARMKRTPLRSDASSSSGDGRPLPRDIIGCYVPTNAACQRSSPRPLRLVERFVGKRLSPFWLPAGSVRGPTMPRRSRRSTGSRENLSQHCAGSTARPKNTKQLREPSRPDQI